MSKRPLGTSGIAIAPLMLGGNVFGWTIGPDVSFRVLDAFTDAGFDAIDTADAYSSWVPGNSGGESETILGDWLASRGQRARVVIATKVGLLARRKGLSRKTIIAACEDSLKRLKTDYIDLYQSHSDDETVPIEETLSAYDTLIKDGKVRAIGASNYSAPRLEAALSAGKAQGLGTYTTLQPHYNLYDRAAFEAALQPLCVARKIGVIPYYALASGFLTGKYRSAQDKGKSPRGGRMDAYLTPRGLRILSALDAVAAQKTAMPAQIALAWLMTRPSITAPIASATSLDQIEQLTGAAAIALSAQDLALLDQASAPEAAR